MNKRNIEIGIDLGTTNSEVAARMPNGDIEVIKNIFNDEYTPSVFGVDKSKNKIVGKKAYERLYKDTSEEEYDNNKAEIKRLMGTSDLVHFERLSQDFSPEEISSEMLKTLKSDVLRKYPNIATTGVVITIPAYFSTLQAEATKRAGNLAGFDHVVLIQEPIAAAIAYGFMNSSNENWIVFDLGGGTFDVALISSKEGSLSVLGHNGDNFLGGKDFDLAIIDRIIVPKILQEFGIKEFHRGNKALRSTFAKLKFVAETAKIMLSQVEEVTLDIENIGTDDNGKEIYLTIVLTRSEFQDLIKPFIDRAIDLTLETIKESGVKRSSISRIILVGGPTMIPYVKERLASDLKLEVDTTSDPLTVVAKGACIYAASQKIPDELIKSEKVSNDYLMKVKLNYETMTSDTEETITGIVEGVSGSNEEFYIQIQSEGGFFSGKKQKVKNGKFIETISLEKNKTTLFWIYLYNSSGEPVKTDPESFMVTHGLSIAGAPIPHSIGVGLAKRDFSSSNFDITEEFEVVFEKNSILPLKETRTYRTTKKLVKGDTQNALPIKVREGESSIPDQNNFICDLKLTGEKLSYDLPEGTEVDITVKVNESREVEVEAYIPLMDLSFSARATVYAENLSIDEIELGLNNQVERIQGLKKTCSDEEYTKAQDLIDTITNSLTTAKVDEDEKRKADSYLKNLKIKLDQLQSNKKMPQLKSEFNEAIEAVGGALSSEEGDSKEKEQSTSQFNLLKAEGEKAIHSEDQVMLGKVVEQLNSLENRIVFSNPSSWVYFFNSLIEGDKEWSVKSEADYYIQKGKRAIETNDLEDLKRSVRGLLELLPVNEQSMFAGNMSGIMK